ncbi:MAG: hypothetical protein U1E52_07910 [Geminicoccaceae bacterium]
MDQAHAVLPGQARQPGGAEPAREAALAVAGQGQMRDAGGRELAHQRPAAAGDERPAAA